MCSLEIQRSSASTSPPPTRRQPPTYAKLVDISRCIGCKGCEVACKEWNELAAVETSNFGSYQSHRDLGPDTWLLMRFEEKEVGGDLRWYITKRACMHCEEPGCLYACPAPGAIVQYTNGIVDFDQDRCIGCQFCVTACPFDVPRFDAVTRKVYKCNLCVDRVQTGLEPACVKTCPTRAISWGPIDEMRDLGRVKVAQLQKRGFQSAALYDPPGVGGTHMMYVVPHGEDLEGYGLPAAPSPRQGALAAMPMTRGIGAGLLGLGLVGVILHYLKMGPEVPADQGYPPEDYSR